SNSQKRPWEATRRGLAEELGRIDGVLVGSVVVRRMRCGKAAWGVRSGPAGVAHRRLAGRAGRPDPQRRVRRPLPPPDRPGHQPAQRRPGRAAIAGALLRQLFFVVTRRIAWDPAVAAGERHEGVPWTKSCAAAVRA
ncbi:MAG: hypothetical protein ACRD03_09285, partial [Acidimicrobiales bacterium]